MERFNPNIEVGLTNEQVKKRFEEDLNYKDVSVPTKTIKRIIRDNLFTLFNFLNFGLALAIALVGAYKNMLFIGTVILNIIISTVQEIRAKKIVDKLSLISQSKVIAIRNKERVELPREDIVLDDDGFLDINNDPKYVRALEHPDEYPVEINTASYKELIKVPGIGLLSARRIVHLQKQGHKITSLKELQSLGANIKKCKTFVKVNKSYQSTLI